MNEYYIPPESFLLNDVFIRVFIVLSIVIFNAIFIRYIVRQRGLRFFYKTSPLIVVLSLLLAFLGIGLHDIISFVVFGAEIVSCFVVFRLCCYERYIQTFWITYLMTVTFYMFSIYLRVGLLVFDTLIFLIPLASIVPLFWGIYMWRVRFTGDEIKDAVGLLNKFSTNSDIEIQYETSVNMI